MAPKKDKPEPVPENPIVRQNVVSRSITTEMKESYLDYAMSVITARALPDVRDGLKPVHRRILYVMHEKGLTASAKFRKSATVVGDVLGGYHPHGDIAVYDSMVKMVQDFTMRYPLVLGQGNWGSIDGDGAAAHRYTEAKMTRLSSELLKDLEKETVEWRPNYDNTKKEPTVLPAAVPNLLLNGTLGIAVGMASNIPPHNLGEVVDATVHLIENKDAATEDLLQFVKGPDFPTGGVIYGAKDIRIVIDLKGGSHPQSVLNFLYKHTGLEEAFHFNVVALVDGVPQTLSLKSILEEFVAHRQDVVCRRTEFDLKKAEDREHILIGLKKALDHIDEIIKLIKKSKDTAEAHKNLMQAFKFSDRQATAILDMKLQRLAGLERKKIEDELDAVQALIKELKEILGSVKKMLGIIKDELKAIKEKYSDPRRTKVVKHAAKNFSMEDTIPDEESVLVLTVGGYIKRTNPDEYRRQKRGGVGVVDLDTKEEDFVTTMLTASTHSDLLFFTDKGKTYQIKMYDIPEGRRATKGKSIMNFLSLSAE